ncbi:MAG TPA: glycoside hydrolase family 3 N-terminal domain-containing protein [Clostridiales bacterium]|nr:glycoside hydrolase family 3 N-terminal domain-containing protein [Clostridiales bacterium]
MKSEHKYIKSLISKMTLDQKIGALLTLGFAGTIARPHIYDYITKYHCGGLRLSPGSRHFGSYIDPRTGKTIVSIEDTRGYKQGISPPYVSVFEYKRILDELQGVAMSRPLGIPLHFSFDQEGGAGVNSRFTGVNFFPRSMGIRATGDSRFAYEAAKAVARQSKSVGFNWIHSPVLDINVQPNNPEIYTRAYSDRVNEVVEYSIEACRGFKEINVIATGKHFPGRGDSSFDAHYDIPIIDTDKKTLMNRELLPYSELIKLNLLPSIMLAHTIYPAIDDNDVATVSKKVVTGLLREELGFGGVVTTDSMTMGGIAVKYGVANACALALEAGADLVLMKAETELVDDTISTIRRFVENGRISTSELDKKVYRVLSLKYEYGLFTYGNNWAEKPEDTLEDRQIIDLSKLVARKSVLIAKDKNKLLPLPRNEEITVIEQINFTPNDIHWHPGILYKNCTKYNRNARYLETAYTYDESDKDAIINTLKGCKTVVITNFYERGRASNNEFISELLANKSNKIVIITNTPYPLSIPKGSDCIIITFGTSPANVEVVAGVLFGGIIPEGEWPIEYVPDVLNG